MTNGVDWPKSLAWWRDSADQLGTYLRQYEIARRQRIPHFAWLDRGFWNRMEREAQYGSK